MADFFGFALFDVIIRFIFSLFGRFFLFARYRNKRKVKLVLLKAYDNSWSAAGSIILLKGLALIVIAFLLGGLLAVLYSIAKQGLYLF